MKKFIIIFLIVIVIAGGITLTLSKSKKKFDEKLIVSPKIGDVSFTVTDTGIVEPLKKVEIKSKIAGQIAFISVEEGKTVKKGQTLIQLDKLQYNYAVDRAQSFYEEKKIYLGFMKKKLHRKRQEYKSNALARHNLDQVEMEYKIAELDLKKARIEWEIAQDNLKHCNITSPIAGVVIFRGVEVGEMVTPGIDATVNGKPLMTIADLSKLIVKSELNQIEMTRIKLNFPAELRFDALPKQKFNGIVHRISPSAIQGQNQVQLFPIEILITSASAFKVIKPGMTADLEILIKKAQNVLTLPVEAIFQDDKGSSTVKLIVKKNAHKETKEQPVVLGLENDQVVEVKKGLTEKSKVLISPKSASANELNI